jgi:transcription antitermination factor NusB
MRRDAREAVFRYLYSYLLTTEDDNETKTELYKEHKLNGKDVEFADSLICVVQKNFEDITNNISQLSIGFDIDRMNYADKSALMIAIAEIDNFKDIDVAVSIDEAVRLVKLYSTEGSLAFVNGILAEYARRIGK